VKPSRFEYAAPSTVDEALHLLDQHGDDAKLLAGGQSFVPVMNFRLASPAILIDLNRIEELTGLRQAEDGSITAGAMTRHRAFERSELIRKALPVVHAAMPYVAHAQIRNRGTIGGSLAHADPAAEWQALCIAVKATMTTASRTGKRRIAAEDFTQGVYQTALAPNEILTDIHFPAWPIGRSWGFTELSRRRGDFAIVGAVCTMDFDNSEQCTAARVVVFGAGDKPVVVDAASDLLIGSAARARQSAEAGRIARSIIEPRSDHHASTAYRSELVEVLTRRAIDQAYDRNRDRSIGEPT
jgi:carbon-monoxide dehydrogenase medium subunit